MTKLEQEIYDDLRKVREKAEDVLDNLERELNEVLYD